MLTVSHVADRYGVTTTFMVRALDQIGCRNIRPDSALSAATIARFESAFGEKIRAARPKSSADAADHDLPLRTARTGGGATWDIAVDDYVSVSEDSNRRITDAS